MFHTQLYNRKTEKEDTIVEDNLRQEDLMSLSIFADNEKVHNMAINTIGKYGDSLTAIYMGIAEKAGI